ncbi:MAG TPA: tetratricopeptide repeat protein [Steroidobacteraceae bacterium]|nr:tetratricopeptide repeat protein [Steroidobacteraceae bacterium]
MTIEAATEESTTESLLREATQFAKTGDHDAARKQLIALLSAEPEHEIALGMLAAVYAEQQQFDQAVHYFRRLLEVNAENVLARFQLGLALLDLHKPNEALAAWQTGNFAENEYLVDYQRGVALMQLDRPQEALNRFQQARLMMPTNHVFYPQLLAYLIQLSQ